MLNFRTNKIKKAFTLAEVMVCLVVLSIITTILIPSLKGLKPNKVKTMFKKAYTVTEQVVTELVNDNDLYPTNANYAGFDNTDEVTDEFGIKYSGQTKFCKLFASKLNIVTTESSTDLTPKANCDGTSTSRGFEADNKTPTFITSDGIEWVLLPILYSINDEDKIEPSYIEIRVDVNGVGKPNCFYNATTCKEPDRFKILVYVNGKMKVPDDDVVAKKYIGSGHLSK